MKLEYSTVAIHSFPVNLAMQLKDVKLAVIVQFFVNVINSHASIGRNYHEGRTWNYCSHEDLASVFPYWSYDQIKRCMQKLVKMKILMVSNFNKMRMDKTNWYAFCDELKFQIFQKHQSAPPFSEEAKPPAEGAKSLEGESENARAIPMTKPMTTPFTKEAMTRGTDEAMPFSCRKKDNEGEHKSSDSKFPLKKDQLQVFKVLKEILPDERDSVLFVMIRTDHKKDPRRFMQCIEHVRNEIAKGTHFKKGAIAFFRHALKNQSLVSETALENKKFAEDFARANKWNNVKITDKYVQCKVTKKEVGTDMQIGTFYEALLRLHETSERYI